MLPDLVLTGRIKSELEKELEEHARMVKEILGESSQIGLGFRKTVAMARPVFINLSLPNPGLTELKDNFYTGWFYTAEGGGIYSAFRKKDDVSLSRHVSKTGRMPYFLLDKTEAESWDEKVKQKPLIPEEIDELFLSPNIEAHPSYESLSRSNLRELTDKLASTRESFWNDFRIFDRSDKSAAKRDFLRDNLLDIVILDRVHHRSYKAALEEIRESMEKNGLTVFPLSQEGCVVRYISDIRDRNKIGSRQTTTRTLPLPHNLMRNFQRYGRLGERPMTKGEFETLYRSLVDPNTKLF